MITFYLTLLILILAHISTLLNGIYKKGTVNKVRNYRGLAIRPAFAKLVSMLLLKRLTRFIDTHNLLSHNQIGVIKNKCTSDHIFLLQTIVEKVVKRRKGGLYVAFIGKLLSRRLNQIDIRGLFLKNIVSMYQKTKYSVKYKNGYLDYLITQFDVNRDSHVCGAEDFQLERFKTKKRKYLFINNTII